MQYKPSETYPYAGTFEFSQSSHTLGNLLRHYIDEQPGVNLVGYAIPHPLKNHMVLNVHHHSISPFQLLQTACEHIVSDIDHILEQLPEEEVNDDQSTSVEEEEMQDE